MLQSEAQAVPAERSRWRIGATIMPFLLSQVLSGSTVVVLTSLSGLIGNDLSPLKWMVTLPNSVTILGTLLSIWPIARSIEKAGWRYTLLLGIAIGIAGACLAITAVQISNFSLYCLACILLGGCIASVQYYVFGATECARTASERTIVISLVTGCGFVSAFLGSSILHLAAFISDDHRYPVSFVILAGVLALAAISLAMAPYPQQTPAALEGPKIGTSGWSAMNGGSLYGMLVSAAAFANMTLLMHATPIAMQICGLGSNAIADVLQWRFIAMYAPAVLTGLLVVRTPPLITASAGLLVGAVACAVGMWMDVSVANFTIALVACGIAWG